QWCQPLRRRRLDADVSEGRRDAEIDNGLDGIGDRLRAERVKAGISQRELARRLGLSASMISQLESGLSKPSVGTLYAIVTELDLSLDRVIRGEDYQQRGASGEGNGEISPLVHPDQRQSIDLASGVRWEELTATSEDGIDFLHATYEVGGASTPDVSLMRHHGREYGYVMSGTLGIQIGFREYELGPGDSIAFDSTRPHRLFNKGDEPVNAIWFVVGRDEDGGASPF
ncbi:MAG: helix-turn-helix domain-containing protein, partial [Acidimicrobiia bacterium]